MYSHMHLYIGSCHYMGSFVMESWFLEDISSFVRFMELKWKTISVTMHITYKVVIIM